MKIRKITLKNYRCYKELDMEFPDGVIGLVGRNGSGKTTIVEGMGWVLFGVTRTEKGDLKCKLASPEEPCRVELEFGLGGNSYRVFRELSGKSLTVKTEIYENGKTTPEASQDRGVRVYIERLIGMDKHTFFRSVFARQKEIDIISDLQPEQRRALFRRLLNIDIIDRTIDKIRSSRRELEAVIHDRKQRLRDIEQLKRDLAGLKKEKISLESDLKRKKTELLGLQTQRDKLKQKTDRLENRRRKFESLRKQAEEIEKRKKLYESQIRKKTTELNRLENEKKQIQRLLPEEKLYNKSKRELEKLQELRLKFQKRKNLVDQLAEEKEHKRSVEEATERLKVKYADFRGVAASLQKLQEQIDKKNSELDKLKEKGAEVRAQVNSFKQDLKKLDDEMKKIKKSGPRGRCPLCKRELGKDYPSIIAHFKQERSERLVKIEYLEAEHEKIKTNLSKKSQILKLLEEKKDKLETDKDKMSKLAERIDARKEQCQEIRTAISKLDAKISAIGVVEFEEEKYRETKKQVRDLEPRQKQIIQLRQEVKRIPDITEEVETAKSELSRCGSKVREIISEMETTKFEPVEYREMKKQYNLAIEQFDKTKDELADIQRRVAIKGSQMEQKTKEIDEERDARRELAQHEEHRDYLKVIEELMDKFRLDLTGRIRPLLSGKASMLLAEVTQGRYPRIELSKDYDIQVEDEGVLYPLNHFSGGEMDLINLCLRIGVSEVVADRFGGATTNLLVLDEVFGSQDIERKDNILRAVHQLSGRFAQLFLITHDEALKDRLDNVVEVQQVSPGRSTARFSR